MNTLFQLSNISSAFSGYAVDRNLCVYSNKRNRFIKLRPKRSKSSSRQYYAFWYNSQRHYIEVNEFKSIIMSNQTFTEWRNAQSDNSVLVQSAIAEEAPDQHLYICGSLEYDDFVFVAIALTEADARSVCEDHALSNPGVTYVYSRVCGRVKTGGLQWH